MNIFRIVAFIFYPEPVMLHNYLKIAFRSIWKNKGYSMLNISGLAVGMALAMLISMWIWDEWSFNKGGGNVDQVGRVMLHSNENGTVSTSPNMPFPLASALRTNFAADFRHVAVSWSTEEYNVLSGDDKFRKKGRFIEPEGALILAPEMLLGHVTALKDASSVLLSESAAKSIFGDRDPLGRTLRLDSQFEAVVAGVYKDFPHNSDYNELAFLAPWDMFTSTPRRQWIKQMRDNWDIKTFEILVETHPNVSLAQASGKIGSLMASHLQSEKSRSAAGPELFIQPMRDWHLYSEWENGVNAGGQIYYLKMFGAIAIFILVLACINFVNLTTARSALRAREVGVRKTVGSLRMQLIFQFVFESFLIVACSFVLALLLVKLSMPLFNQFAEKSIEFTGADGVAGHYGFWLISAAACILVSLLAGSYPAFFLSSFKPVKILKGGNLQVGRYASVPRRALVILQFTVSVSLIIGTAGVFQQIQFGRNRSTGYEKEGLLNVQLTPGSGPLDALKNDLLQSGVVAAVAQSSGPVTDVLSNARGFYWQGKPAELQENFAVIAASHTYGETVGWKVTAGRDFSAAYQSDSSAIIINESAAKYLGFSDPVGKTVRWKDGTFNDTEYHIVGVVKDMVMQSPFEPVKQTIYFMTYAPNFLYIKLNPGAGTAESLGRLQELFAKHLPASVFDFKFAEDQYDAKFSVEKRLGNLASFFAIIAIFISCLGLLGLAAFTAERRKSEIGVRKVLGASIAHVWLLISKEYILLTIAAVLIAVPLSYYFLDQMLARYQYRTTLSWWIFAGAGLGAIVLTLLTVSYQTVKVALLNPVKSLRAE